MADHIGGIAYSLAGMGSNSKLPEFKPFHDLVPTARKRRATDDMTAEQLLQHIADHL